MNDHTVGKKLLLNCCFSSSLSNRRLLGHRRLHCRSGCLQYNASSPSASTSSDAYIQQLQYECQPLPRTVATMGRTVRPITLQAIDNGRSNASGK